MFASRPAVAARAGVVAAVALAATSVLLAGPAAAADPVITCRVATLQLVLTHPRATSGTMTLDQCTSKTNATITSGTATITGVASGVPEALMNNEVVSVSWKNSGGTEVGTSTIGFIRALIGEEAAMVSHADGSFRSGLFNGASVNQDVDQMTRTCVTNTCTFSSVTSQNKMTGY
jgi:hypothetical protein